MIKFDYLQKVAILIVHRISKIEKSSKDDLTIVKAKPPEISQPTALQLSHARTASSNPPGSPAPSACRGSPRPRLANPPYRQPGSGGHHLAGSEVVE